MGLFDNLREWSEEQNPNSPQNVAKAYGLLNEKLKEDEDKAEERMYQRNFDNFEEEEYKEPSPLERWNNQINAMMTSGNETMQSEALKMISQYQQRATAPPAAGAQKPTAWREYKLAQTEGYDGDFEDWKALQKTSGTTINMGNKYIPPSAQMVDAKGTPIQTPVGMTYEEANEAGYKFAKIPTAEEAKQGAAMATSVGNLDRLNELVTEKGADLSGLPGILTEFRGGSSIAGATVNHILTGMGVTMTPENVEALSLTTGLSNSLLAAYRGAQVGPKEQIMFNKQLPMPGQPPEVFLANLLRTQADLGKLTRLISEGRNFTGSPLYYEMTDRGDNTGDSPAGWTPAGE